MIEVRSDKHAYELLELYRTRNSITKEAFADMTGINEVTWAQFRSETKVYKKSIRTIESLRVFCRVLGHGIVVVCGKHWTSGHDVQSDHDIYKLIEDQRWTNHWTNKTMARHLGIGANTYSQMINKKFPKLLPISGVGLLKTVAEMAGTDVYITIDHDA